jgi:3-oxoacyl-[acyl-carrier protein] reductase
MSDYLHSQFGLAGRRALVTGAGRGIGKAIALALSAAGAEVCIHFNTSRGAAEAAVTEIVKGEGRAWAFQADLTDPKQVKRMADDIKRRWSALDILVNNSGDLVQRSPVADLTDELIDQTIKVNLSSLLYCTRACIPLLTLGSAPCIVNLGSVAAHHGGGNGATLYASTKGAIHTLTRGLAKELAPAIRVNGIAPGVIMTDFHRRHSTDELLKNFANSTPLKRLGIPQDVAGAAVFLCSPAASFITGEVVEVNGGLWLA